MSHDDDHVHTHDGGLDQAGDRADDRAGRPREDARDEERAVQRAGAVAEEERAGADDPEAQAAVVLAESDERTEDPSGTRASYKQTQGVDDTDTPPSDTTQLNA